MSTYGSPLFSRNKVLTRYLEDLPLDAHAAIGELLDEEKKLNQPQLIKQLKEQFLLTPLEGKPVYGYGWLIRGKPRRQVPAAFTMIARTSPASSLQQLQPRTVRQFGYCA